MMTFGQEHYTQHQQPNKRSAYIIYVVMLSAVSMFAYCSFSSLNNSRGWRIQPVAV